MTLPGRSRRIVGRETELARVRAAAGLTESMVSMVSMGGQVLISGDAGIGKSRIVAELGHDAAAADWTVVVGHCVGAGGSAVPYLPVSELLGALDQQAGDVVDGVLVARPELGRLLPTGRSSLRPGRQPGWHAAASAPPEPGRIAEAVHACLTAAGAARPLLVIVEDVHWADHSTQDLLTLLLTRGFTTRVGLVVTYRADDLHRGHPLNAILPVWTRLAGLHRLDLAPLPAASMRALVTALEGAPTDSAAVADVVARADGNAFYAEELVAGGPASGASTDSGGNGSIGGTGDLDRLLLARLDRLDEPARLVVRAAAVGGRTISHDLLADVAGLDESALEEALRAAVDHQILHLTPDDGYAFRHALLAEAIASDVLPGTRRRLHTAYLHALQRQPGRGGDAELARHAAAVGDTCTATRASAAAGDAAMAVGGPRDALRHFELALRWEQDVAQRASLSVRAAGAAVVAGDRVRSVALLREAVQTTPADTHPEQRAELLAELGWRLRVLDMGDDPLELTSEAVRLLASERTGPRPTVLLAHLQMLVDHRLVEAAEDLAQELLSLATELGRPGIVAEIRLILSQLLASPSDLQEAETRLHAMLEELTGRDDQLRLRVLLRLGLVRMGAGRLRQALLACEQGYAVGLRTGRPWAPYALECRLYAGVIAYQLGDWDRATALLDTRDEGEIPQPGAALIDSAALLVAAGRGRDVTDAVLDGLRPWWEVDALAAAYTVYAAIDLLGQCGDVPALLDVVDDALTAMDRAWGTYAQNVVRIAALTAGQATTLAPAADEEVRTRLLSTVDRLAGRARTRLAETPSAQLAAPGLESRMWGHRLEAEMLRLAAALGAGSDAEARVARVARVVAWERAVTAFESYGHVPETARSQARLAQALHDAGRGEDAAQVAAQARTVAERLGAVPLLRELGRLEAQQDRPEGDVTARQAEQMLTPREREVLALVAEGLSNGQIGRRLVISTKTASVHVSNILAKIGAANRTEAVAIARHRNLLGGDP